MNDVIWILKNQKVSQKLFYKLYKCFKNDNVFNTYVKYQKLTSSFIDKNRSKISLEYLCDNPCLQELLLDKKNFVKTRNIIVQKISEVGLDKVDTRILLVPELRMYYSVNELTEALIKKIIRLENNY